MRLVRVAVGRGDHSAGEGVRDGGAVVLTDEFDAQVDPGRGAGGGVDSAVWGEEDGLVDVDAREAAPELVGVASQCVVARRPSSRPAWARANAPERIAAIRAPCSCASATAVRTSVGCWAWTSAQAGTTTVSAATRLPSLNAVVAVKPPVIVAPGSVAHSRNLYHGSASAVRGMPNTSHAMAALLAHRIAQATHKRAASSAAKSMPATTSTELHP